MVYQYFVRFSYVCADENVFGCTLADSVVLDTADTVVTIGDAIGASNDYLTRLSINFIPDSILVNSIEELKSEKDVYLKANKTYLNALSNTSISLLKGDYDTWASGANRNVISITPFYNPLDATKINILILSADG